MSRQSDGQGVPPRRRWRPLRTGLVGTLATLIGLGTALQGFPELVPGGGGPLLAAVGLLGTATAVTAQVILDRLSQAQAAGLKDDHKARRRSIPAPVDHFIGHEPLMAELLARFERFPRPGPRGVLPRVFGRNPGRYSRGPLLIAINGEGGTGKSQLAAQIVDRVADRFPDGHVEFALYGNGNSGPSGQREPAAPETVLRMMIAALGESPAEGSSPAELSERWKTITEDLRLLVVLDNAKDFAQVEPLLPSGRGCAVLITSRAEFDDTPLPVLQYGLQPLFPGEGLELINRLVKESGRELSDEDREYLPELVRACHGLPLALCLAGTQLTLSNAPSVRKLLERMEDPEVPGAKAVARSLAFSLQRCEPGERLLLYRLAGTGLTKFSPWAAAALMDIGAVEAKRMLERMSHRFLVTDLHGAGGFDRYQIHDRVRDTLLRAELEHLGVPEAERHRWSKDKLGAAVDRLLDAFARIAEAAARDAAPHEWGFGSPFPQNTEGTGGEGSGENAAGRGGAEKTAGGTEKTADGADVTGGAALVAAPDDPFAWLESEHRGFEVCFRWTDPSREDRRSPAHGWRLRRAFTVLSRTGLTRWGAVHETTRQATELALEMENPFAYGVAMLDWSEVAGSQGDHDSGYKRALAALQALEVLDPPVDPRWLARAHRAVGVNLYRRGDLDDGRAEIERAERIFATDEDPWWHVRTLGNLAEVDRFQGHLVRAHTWLSQAEGRLDDSPGMAEQRAKVQLQRGEVLRLRGYPLNAWFVLSDGLDQLTRPPKEDWYRARYLRSLGQLSVSELNSESGACEVLLDPQRARERRRRTRNDPAWPEWQRAKVEGMFIDLPQQKRKDGESGEEEAGREEQSPGEGTAESTEDPLVYAYRCVEPGPARGLLFRLWKGRRLVRDEWDNDRQVERLQEAELIFEEIGDAWGRWRTCLALGQALMAHDRGQGKEEFLRAARSFRELGDKWWHARAHRMAADSLRRAERWTEAEELALVAVRGYRGLQHRSGHLRAMLLHAEIVTRRDLLKARGILLEAEEMAEEGVRLGVVPGSLLVKVQDMLRVVEHGSGPAPRPTPPRPPGGTAPDSDQASDGTASGSDPERNTQPG